MKVISDNWRKTRKYKKLLKSKGYDLSQLKGKVLEFNESREKVYLWSSDFWGVIIRSWRTPSIDFLIVELEMLNEDTLKNELLAIREDD